MMIVTSYFVFPISFIFPWARHVYLLVSLASLPLSAAGGPPPLRTPPLRCQGGPPSQTPLLPVGLPPLDPFRTFGRSGIRNLELRSLLFQNSCFIPGITSYFGCKKLNCLLCKSFSNVAYFFRPRRRRRRPNDNPKMLTVGTQNEARSHLIGGSSGRR
jgi:hypothetical protein